MSQHLRMWSLVSRHGMGGWGPRSILAFAPSHPGPPVLRTSGHPGRDGEAVVTAGPEGAPRAPGGACEPEPGPQPAAVTAGAGRWEKRVEACLERVGRSRLIC